MSQALAKLRTQIFRRFRPSDYGIALDSEKILPPQGTSVGGLAYQVLGADNDVVEVHIRHEEGMKFVISTLRMIPMGLGANPQKTTGTVQSCLFSGLDSVLMHALKPRWKADGSPDWS